MDITPTDLEPGQRVVSDFSGREGTITRVYHSHVIVQFDGYREPTPIGFIAACIYRRIALGG